MASGSMPALSALLVKGDVACVERIYFRGGSAQLELLAGCLAVLLMLLDGVSCDDDKRTAEWNGITT